ncbi:MAG: 6-phosphogluconate dehydrogenase [Flavobacteriales bacterium]|jgi:hypothetical protein|nr:6-phosphogluconate dehydrogenase [Flavobacteriales bacterium]
MKKAIIIFVSLLILLIVGYFSAIYYLHFSDGFRSGELVKISRKGMIFKTWEGELSQGISENLRFKFSVEKSEEEVIQQLIDLQGKTVRLKYIERYGTFPWMGDSKYYVTKVEARTEDKIKENSEE